MQVHAPKAQALADEFGMQYVETSANVGIGVTEAFTSLAQAALRVRLEHDAKKAATSAAAAAAAVPVSSASADARDAKAACVVA